LASGCGGDSGAQSLSKGEFIAHASAICERNKARADRLFKRDFADLGHREPTLAESQRMLAAMLPIIRDSGAAIATL
jgi:surfactin synthase thioesterase subunit